MSTHIRAARVVTESVIFPMVIVTFKTASGGVLGCERFRYPQSAADRIYQYMPGPIWYVTVLGDPHRNRAVHVGVGSTKPPFVGVDGVPVAEGVKLVVRYINLMAGA